MSVDLFGWVCRKCRLATNLFVPPSFQSLLTGFLALEDVFAGGTRTTFFSKPWFCAFKFTYQICSEQAEHKFSSEQTCFSSHFFDLTKIYIRM